MVDDSMRSLAVKDLRVINEYLNPDSATVYPITIVGYASPSNLPLRMGIDNESGIILLRDSTNNTRTKITAASGDLSFINYPLCIGTNSGAVTSSVLELTSTSKGFLPPRMTSAQRGAIAAPATGLIVYDTDLNQICVWVGAKWQKVTQTDV